MTGKTRFWIATGAGSLAMLAVSAPAQAPELAMLGKVERGQWTLKERGKAEIVDRICVRDARKLLQIRHRDAQCTRYVIEDDPDKVTVSYSCAGQGNGRTTIKFEDSRLLQISSQGIADNSPFSFVVEARYTGACGS